MLEPLVDKEADNNADVDSEDCIEKLQGAHGGRGLVLGGAHIVGVDRVGLNLYLRIRILAMGPPWRLARINPNVAQAAPISMAFDTPYSDAGRGAQAMAVPWPPMWEIVPPMSPAAVGSPKRRATPTPMKFCRNIYRMVKMRSGFPPRAKSFRRALIPMVVKK